ncbi:MAG: isocitrate/isopropylmalate dehydrogenase family protein [Spirochaetota bacterium]|nr:isocitrate/isopropylmalate dehydrogenase family protein [Spirochaetota bacterium]
MAYNITLVRGDGVGPELAEAAKRCIDATGVNIDWDIVDAGIDVMEKEGTPLPVNVIESIKNNRVAIKAPITTPIGSGFRSVNVQLRKELDLYACLRPCKYYKGVNSSLKKPEVVDLVVIRENTEDLYAGIEFEKDSPEAKNLIDYLEKLSKKKIKADSGISIKPISVSGTERIVKFAFEYAKKHQRKKVTSITKSNIMKFSDGLFQHVSEEVAERYKEIEFEHKLVDNMCMQLVQKPEIYDVLVLPNLYGDIISDLCAGLIGGLGLAPGANIGDDYAVFEATHGSAPKYKGLNKVNPTALILSGVLMLHHINEDKAAYRLEKAVASVIEECKYVTYDLKPFRDDPTAVGTMEMADEIIKKMENG